MLEKNQTKYPTNAKLSVKSSVSDTLHAEFWRDPITKRDKRKNDSFYPSFFWQQNRTEQNRWTGLLSAKHQLLLFTGSDEKRTVQQLIWFLPPYSFHKNSSGLTASVWFLWNRSISDFNFITTQQEKCSIFFYSPH